MFFTESISSEICFCVDPSGTNFALPMLARQHWNVFHNEAGNQNHVLNSQMSQPFKICREMASGLDGLRQHDEESPLSLQFSEGMMTPLLLEPRPIDSAGITLLHQVGRGFFGIALTTESECDLPARPYYERKEFNTTATLLHSVTIFPRLLTFAYEGLHGTFASTAAIKQPRDKESLAKLYLQLIPHKELALLVEEVRRHYGSNTEVDATLEEQIWTLQDHLYISTWSTTTIEERNTIMKCSRPKEWLDVAGTLVCTGSRLMDTNCPADTRQQRHSSS
jgi:hypothetical protein